MSKKQADEEDWEECSKKKKTATGKRKMLAEFTEAMFISWCL